MSQLRRAHSLFASWQESRLSFHNFAERITVTGEPVACELLAFFSRWRTPAQAVAHFKKYSSRSVLNGMAQLTRLRLLLTKDSPQATRDARIAKEWAPWLPEASFHFATKDTRYLDRSNWPLAKLETCVPKTPQPAKVTIRRGSTTISLPPRISPEGEFGRVLTTRKTHRRFSTRKVKLEQIAQLLSLVWGVNGYRYSPRYGKLFHKTSPSGGARHPGEVYLMALRVEGLRPGLYHYHPLQHRLARIGKRATPQQALRYCAGQHFVKDAAALFLMTAVFARTMWKYDHPRAYRVVLLDAGHLCQTFCLVATWLGLGPFCTAALKDTLIEHDLRIDGIRESVLYVAGVGVPVAAKQQASR